MKYENFMVVGGAGFVGSNIVDQLIEKGAKKVVVMDNLFLGNLRNLTWAKKNGNVIIYIEDARYITALENIIEKEKPDVIFNVAVKCLPYGFIDPEGSFMTGVEIALNLASLLRKNKFKRLLHFSSSEAYGTALYVPMNEKHPLYPATPYGAGKAAADHLLLSYNNLFGCEITIIRPFNLYGPRQNMKLYAAIIPLTISRILHNESPELHGDGEQTRDFTFVKDVAKASISLVECDNALGKIINIGQAKETKMKDIINQICTIMNYPESRVLHLPTRIADVGRLYAGNDLAKKLINYTPETTLEEGLKQTINWYSSETNGMKQ
jgi:UDP-glucose 4-epimerase